MLGETRDVVECFSLLLDGVLYRFLSALQQNRAKSKFLYLLYDKESNYLPTYSTEFSNQTARFSEGLEVTSAVLCFLIKHLANKET